MTRPADKFPALSGLASIFSERINASYVAGIWSDSLIEGIAWQGLNNYEDFAIVKLQEYVAPSWSWASFQGIVAVGVPSSWQEITEVIDLRVEYAMLNPYGELHDCWIKLKAPLVRVTTSDLSGLDEEDDLNALFVRIKTPGGEECAAKFDGLEYTRKSWLKNIKLFALLLGYTGSKKMDPGDTEGAYQYFALVVSPASEDDHTRFQRLG